MGVVLIADPSSDFVSGVATVLAGNDTFEVRNAESASPETVDSHDAYVVVVGPNLTVQAGLDLAARLTESSRPTHVLVVSKDVTTDLLRRALRAGVSDVLDADASAGEILDAVVTAHEASRRERAHDDAVAVVEETDTTGGKVVTVFSTKGGVGKTVLSTNLATAMVTDAKLNTVIVDLDLQFGDVAIMLGLEPQRTIADAVNSIDRLDTDMLSAYLTEHSSGLKALLAPVRPEEAETVTTGRITTILGLLRRMFDVVIVDTAATFDEVVLTALDASDLVFPVTMMDVASIKNTRISLQKLEQLGYQNGLLQLVLNRADSKVWLQPTEVEKAVGRSIFAKIPSDRVVPRSVNKGTPVVLDAPKSEVSKAIVGLARGVARSAKEMSTDVA